MFTNLEEAGEIRSVTGLSKEEKKQYIVSYKEQFIAGVTTILINGFQ